MHIHAVIPAYNEAGRIQQSLETLWSFSRHAPFHFTVTIVDDGSRDPTGAIVRAFQQDIWKSLRYFRLPANRGKGAAVRFGMLHLPSCQWALLSDTDLSTPLEEIEKLLQFQDQAGILIGSRALDPSLIHIRQPFIRQNMGKVFNLLIRLMLFQGFYDTQCGFKLFRAHLARELFQALKTEGFAFDVEIIGRALLRGYRVLEIPVRWDHRESSRVNLIRAPLRMFWELLRLRLRLGRIHPSFPPFFDGAPLQKG